MNYENDEFGADCGGATSTSKAKRKRPKRKLDMSAEGRQRRKDYAADMRNSSKRLKKQKDDKAYRKAHKTEIKRDAKLRYKKDKAKGYV